MADQARSESETAMTPQERQLVDDLFDRLGKLETAPRDPDAAAAISQGLRRAPSAIYALVQTVLLQDEALKRANAHIQELESAGAGEQSQSGGFLDTMRDALFGQNQNQPRSSVPNVRPPEASHPVWNSGQALPQAAQYNQAPYAQPYGAPQPPMGGGGSFLGTAAAAAAGVVGGSLLLGGIRSMMGGGSHQSFADASTSSLAGDRSSPWSSTDLSSSDLARDAGIGDIGSSGQRADSSGTGLLDQASNDAPDHDDMDLDSDDFGSGDNDSDYA
jgi:uncharacterized protein